MSFSALVQLRQRLRRRRRRIAFGLLILAGVVACLWAVLIEGTVLRYVVARVIGSQLNATCTIDEFHWNGWSRAEIRGISLRVDGWPESASEVASIARMRADFDPLPLLWGSLALTDITIDEMTIQAIERADGSEINLMQIRLPEARRGTIRPPRINIQGLSLKLGALQPDSDKVVFDAQRDLVGGIFSDRAVRSKWHLELTQREPTNANPPRLTGWLVGESFEYAMTLSNLELDDALGRLFPGPIRQLWKEMELTGNIDQVTMSGDRDYPVRNARIEVRDIDMALPDPGLANAWAHYRDGVVQPDSRVPRIKVERGVVRFDEWRVELEELRGTLASSDSDTEVVAMPVEVSFSVDLHRGRLRNWDGKDAEGWAEAALEYAPFDLHVLVQNFAFKPVDGVPPTLALPREAAAILSNFMVREGTISIEAHVSRAAPIWRNFDEPGERDPDEGPIASELRYHGAIAIQSGRGGYFKFPYELNEVQAHITFADDVVNVHYLRGRGSERAEVAVSGTVLDPGDDAGVDLRITSDRAPIDLKLEQALRYSPAQRFLTLLFNRPVFASLEASGVLTQTVKVLQDARDQFLLNQSLPEQPKDEGETEEQRIAKRSIAAQVRRFKVLDWLTDFQPGGWCALNLRVQRDIAGGERVVTTGAITLLEANAICESLPYPLRVLGRDVVGAAGATITLEDERILLPEGGLRLHLPGGGEGVVSGSIELPRGAHGDRVVTPDVRIETRSDAINPLLLAAIPTDDPDGPIRGAHDGWPGTRRSEAAEILDSIGLEGLLAANIELGGDGAGDVTWRAVMELTEGSAVPHARFEHNVAESGLEWPSGFLLERCTASVVLDESRARLVAFEGWHVNRDARREGADGDARHDLDGLVRSEGAVRGEGEANLESGARWLRVKFDRVSPGHYMVNLLPQHERERGQRFWVDHDPRGVFNAELDWSKSAEGRQRRKLRVEPEWISFRTVPPKTEAMFQSGIVTITRESGDLLLVDRTLEARGLSLHVDEPGLPRSSLVLNGRYGASLASDEVALGASWTNARFESPLLIEGLHLTGAEEAVEVWHEIRPHGRFDAILTTLASPKLSESAWRIRLEVEELSMTLDDITTAMQVDPASQAITIEPSLVTVPLLVATTDNGRFQLEGEIPLDRGIATDRVLHVQYDGARLGPPELALVGSRARAALDAIDFACTGPTRLHQGELRFGLADQPFIARFAGAAEFSGASFRAGVPFEQLAGSVRVDIDPVGRSRIDIDARSFVVSGHLVRDASATVLIESDGSLVQVPAVNGILAGGSASAGATVRFDDSEDGGNYEVWAKLVGGQLSELPAGRPDTVGAPPRGARFTANASGRVDGSLQIGGPLNNPEARLGRGQLEIRDGRMADLPITMSLLQVSQLMLPLNTALDRGDIRFHIVGNLLVFDRFELTSPTLAFRGSGDLDLRTDELAMRFRNRGTLPLWSDFFGAVSDALYAIDVRGPLGDPNVSVAPLPPFNRAPSSGREEHRP